MGRKVVMVADGKPDFGNRMKRQREERGVSLRRIADATKISVSALEALERNDISRLPGGIFSRAFVRSYAIEIGLDPEQTVRDFLVQFPHDSVTVGSPHAPQDLDPPRKSSRWGTVLTALAISVLIGVILFLVSRQLAVGGGQ
jgi:cytoskeletal protein RodZ